MDDGLPSAGGRAMHGFRCAGKAGFLEIVDAFRSIRIRSLHRVGLEIVFQNGCVLLRALQKASTMFRFCRAKTH